MTPTPTTAATARPDLPELALEAWEPTKTTVGPDRRQDQAGRHRPRNHWWNLPLYWTCAA